LVVPLGRYIKCLDNVSRFLFALPGQ
jgi:hypothetical protein